MRTVLVEALEQARDNQIVQRRSGISERGSGARDTELRKSDYKGDVFYEPVWPAGHVGIFGGNDWIVEAPGLGQVSHWKWVWDKRVLPGTRYFTTMCRRRLRMRLLTTPIITSLSVPIALTLL